MFLGIDIGTSSVKAVLVDDSRRSWRRPSAPLSVDRPQPLFAEQDPHAWWRATVQAVEHLPANGRAQVHAIGLSGQMHGATLLDRADNAAAPGDPLE